MELDLKNIQLLEIVDEDKKEAPKLISKLSENYAPIKDIYHYLQGKSSQYPNIDFTTMRELFVKKLPVDQHPFRQTQYDVALREANSMHGRAEELKKNKRPGFSRFMFMEVCLRMAKLIYSTNAKYDQYNDEESCNSDTYFKFAFSMSKALDIFFKNILLPFREETKINWQAFRD